MQPNAARMAANGTEWFLELKLAFGELKTLISLNKNLSNGNAINACLGNCDRLINLYGLNNDSDNDNNNEEGRYNNKMMYLIVN